jgi:segregation and condensation protein A
VEDKIKEILKILQEKKTITFEELFYAQSLNEISRIEIIVTFLALLELLRLKIVRVYQELPFGKILINLEEENVYRSNF